MINVTKRLILRDKKSIYLLSLLVAWTVTLVSCDETTVESLKSTTSPANSPTTSPSITKVTNDDVPLVSNASETSNQTNSKNVTTVHTGHFNPFISSSDAVLRAIYVASGILLIIIIYGFIRIRRKNKKNKWRKYGLLKNNSEVELVPLDQQPEDEEENTMFDARSFKKAYK